MKKNLRNCAWYTLTLSLMVFAFTIFALLGFKVRYIKPALIVSLLPQLFGLVYYLHDKRTAQPSAFMRTVLFLCRLSVLGVVSCLLIGVYSLSNEYHNNVPVTPADAQAYVTVEETDDLYILYPNYTSVELETGIRPSRKDKSVLLCCGAAYQLDYSFGFTHEKICGDHVSHGQLYAGYKEPGLRMGAFAFYDGEYRFASPEEAETLVLTAAERGGCALFQQSVIENGEITEIPSRKCRCYRMLTELNGKLCIIDSKKPCYFSDFAAAAIELGVRQALNLDMGSGWNYSWYRNSAGKVKTLIGLPWPFSHNWLAFIG